ncbi:MAG: hypothetical protein AB7Q81_14020 [Gammaproteobacteria bacterium]
MLISLKRLGLAAAFTLAVGATQGAAAASVTLFDNSVIPSSFSMLVPEGRQTLLEVLNPVHITQLGATIDPASSTQAFDWRIYASTAGAAVGAAVFTQAGNTFTDVGLATYDTDVAVSLDPGYYLLELFVASAGNVTMARYNESGQGLPRVTSDANFRVLNGYSTPNNIAGLEALGNSTILPAFSVTTGAPVPLPAPALLLPAALAVLVRRRGA